MPASGRQHGSQSQHLILPFLLSLPSSKSSMFQPAGARVSLDLSWRGNIPFFRSPSCPRLPARQTQGASQGVGITLEVKQRSQEWHLPR